MHSLTLGPHRGSDWLGRSAYAGREPHLVHESFVLCIAEPSGPNRQGRSLRLRLSLDASGAGTCEATLMTGARAGGFGASEHWPAERVRLDPERAGLGIGECQMGAASSHGLVKGGDGALAWRLAFRGGGGHLGLLGADRLYRPGHLSHKVALLVLGATIDDGELELWHGLGRFADVTRLPLAGWRVNGWHLWGTAAQGEFTLIDLPELPTGGALAAVAFATQGRLRSYRPVLGAWHDADGVVSFGGRPGLTQVAPRGGEPVEGDGQSIALYGPMGTLTGLLTRPHFAGDATERLTGRPASATFTGTFRPRRSGAPRVLPSAAAHVLRIEL